MNLTEDINYNILGYYKVRTIDSLGDISQVDYYRDYDEPTTTYSNLKVKETRTYTRSVTTGLLEKREMTIEFYKAEGVVGATKNTTKIYTAEEGYDANKKARQNLIDKASMYLLSEVGLTDAKAFWNTVRNEVSDYVNASQVQEMVDAINNSAETYMTATIKATMVGILNVSYTT